MSWRTHDNYAAVAAAARYSHAQGRSTAGISPRDVDRARLYCHALTSQVIGTFHATRVALEAVPTGAGAEPWRRQALHGLEALLAQALDPIYPDFRAVVSSFHRYDASLRLVLDALDGELNAAHDARIEVVRDRYTRAIERITASNGVAPARDDVVPEQASFVVPNLGITIVPLVYGDRHCWDLAYLAGNALDVPRHMHRDGVEIHLGFGELSGHTALGPYRAEVKEGYAMAIPPGTPHGYFNTSGHEHILPFIFGSARLGGWGILPDVIPQPARMEDLKPVPANSAQMNGLVMLDREIERTAKQSVSSRRTLIGPQATYRPHSGAIVLSVARVTGAGMSYPTGAFRIVSVARGHGVIEIGSVRAEVGVHDHFGIPAGMSATVRERGNEPLILLDAVLNEKA